MEIICWPARVNPRRWWYVRALGGGRGVIHPVASDREQESVKGAGLNIIGGALVVGRQVLGNVRASACENVGVVVSEPGPRRGPPFVDIFFRCMAFAFLQMDTWPQTLK